MSSSPMIMPVPANIKLEPGQQVSTQQRGRRKRVAIEIPADMELENMDPKDVKKIKNRIAAARLRERSQQQIRELQTMVQYYKARTEYLEGITAGCVHCSSLTQLQLPPQGQDLQAMSQQVASPHHHHHHHQEPNANDSQCNSPASSTDDDYMGGDLTLDDIDCDLLSKLLLMSE